MKSVQRKFGTFMKRSENEADTQTVLSEFKAADDMLDGMIADLKAWRNAWEDILKLQYDTSEAFADLYKPIEPTSDPDMVSQPVQTPGKYMQKCLGLQKEYSDERNDLAQEITLITSKLLRPAEEAKQHTKLLHKTLKHRDNMKLDYERYLSRAEHVRKKESRNAKEEAALTTHEANLAQAQISYQTADEQVRETFPPITAAVLSLLPHLLVNQIMLQTTLVGQLYTVLDGYTKKFGFPNPSPPDAEIITTWDNEFTSLRRELEGGISVVAQGKAVHLSMSLPAEKDKSTITGLGIRNKGMGLVNRKKGDQTGLPHRPGGSLGSDSTAQIEDGSAEPAPLKPPRPGGLPSPGMASPGMRSVSMPSPSVNLDSKPKLSPMPINGRYEAPYDFKPSARPPSYPNQASDQSAGGATPPSRYLTPVNGTSPLPTGGSDYFGNRRASQASSIASSAASAVAAKKKPPPPVPAKRIPSQPLQYVTALYDFEGQNPGDLAFREGDRIKVVKKTDSTDDWWDGTLGGRVGSFPANYVQL